MSDRNDNGYRNDARYGFTLVELLVATVVTLLMVLALAQAFAVVSSTVANNRAMLEMAGQLRSTGARLQQDLDSVPSPVVPFQPSGAARGFVEYRDGPLHDLSYFNSMSDSSLGDIDDYLQFLAESVNSPFSGRFSPNPLSLVQNSTLLHSNQAEIAWWTIHNDRNADSSVNPGETFTIYRRVLLVRPDLNGTTGYFLQLPAIAGNWYDTTNQSDLAQLASDLQKVNNEIDVSWHAVRIVNGNSVRLLLVANSVSDLSFRPNRFAHDPIVSVNLAVSPPTYTYNPVPAARPNPYGFVAGFKADWNNNWFGPYIKSGDRIGEDVMLTSVLSFDVRAYDPLAAVSMHPGADAQWGFAGVDDDNNSATDDESEAGWPDSDDECVTPGDRAYGTALLGNPPRLLQIASGAYVDLNYVGKGSLAAATIPASQFYLSGGSATFASINEPLYDTWTLDYESNQIDEDGDGLIDESINGVDNNSSYGADDALERETSPPYPVDLRGLQVRIRVLDFDTRQVRQSTVSADYTSE